jgi:siroheme synthase-like protein
MRFLPVAIDVRTRRCVVVGGGSVGARKAATLVRAGADVVVVAPEVTRDLARKAESGALRWVEERFAAEHVAGAFLVVMATDDDALNAAGAGLAAERGAMVCDASSSRRSSLIFGALLEEDGVTVAAFTDGRSPRRAKRKRDEIAAMLAAKGRAT